MAAVTFVIGTMLGIVGTAFFFGCVKQENENAYYEQGYQDGLIAGRERVIAPCQKMTKVKWNLLNHMNVLRNILK